MFKILLILMIASFNVLTCSNLSGLGAVYASGNETYFARVMADGVYFYRQPIDSADYLNVYFELPRSFFVELTDEYNSDFYSARYFGIDGYVKKEGVTAIVGRPICPNLTTVSLRIYSEQSQNMRKLPTSAGGNENQECFLPQDNSNITYIGKIYGEQLVKNRTNVWYYCKFTDSADHFGYIYSEFCDDGDGNDIIIPVNIEDVTYTSNPTFHATAEQTSLPVESKTTWVVIAILSVPAVIFILMFLKGGKIFKKEKKILNKEITDY